MRWAMRHSSRAGTRAGTPRLSAAARRTDRFRVTEGEHADPFRGIRIYRVAVMVYTRAATCPHFPSTLASTTEAFRFCLVAEAPRYYTDGEAVWRPRRRA